MVRWIYHLTEWKKIARGNWSIYRLIGDWWVKTHPFFFFCPEFLTAFFAFAVSSYKSIKLLSLFNFYILASTIRIRASHSTPRSEQIPFFLWYLFCRSRFFFNSWSLLIMFNKSISTRASNLPSCAVFIIYFLTLFIS